MESFVNLGIDVPGCVRQFHVVFPHVSHQLGVDIEPDIERKMDCVLPLQHEARGIHFHRLAVDGKSEPLLHHAGIYAGLPDPDLKLSADESLNIMAPVEVGCADDGSLSVRSVRLGDVVDSVL